MLCRFRTVAGLIHIALLMLLSATLGCGSESGSHVSGKVSFNGQPVPEGNVYFVPDSTAGNSGTTGFAVIKDGMYDTSAEGGRAPSPGAVIVQVEGIDPTPPPNAEPDVIATLLFSGYEEKVTLPDSESVRDIEVPLEAAARQSRPSTAQISP